MAENMGAVILTSSVLILALLILRRIFREKISRRIQYALWGLVLVRLLLPVSLPALNFSVLAMAEPARTAVAEQAERLESPVKKQENPVSEIRKLGELTVTEILQLVWLAGVTAMTLWLVISNFGFAAKLRRNRTAVKVPGCKRQVYLIKSGLDSPCLFGVLRPAVYLTPAAAASQAVLRHVLAHEETHARHLDPLWSLLRGVCLALYWFHPLVWTAAFVSKIDGELACDEGAVILLGEEERLAYGRTLLGLVPAGRGTNPLLSATTMSADKKYLRDRIARIAENRKTGKTALCAAALLTAGACLATFAGDVNQDMKKLKDGSIADAPPEVIAALWREVKPKGLNALVYCDWRVISLSGPWYEYFHEDDQALTVEIYRYAYEYRAVMPSQTELVGGMYMDEDGWGCPGYPNCDFLFFRVEEDGGRTYLFRAMENDCSPGGAAFREDLEQNLVREGLLQSVSD